MQKAMSDIQNLTHEEGKAKLKKLIEDIGICQFTTNLSQVPLAARPMATSEVDEDGNLWFISKDGSDKNTDIEMDNRVQLFYSKNNASEYLSVYGEATIIKGDKAKIEKYWSSMANNWFDGKEDPSITLIKVVPKDSYYWDTKSNRYISFSKLIVGAITGNGAEVGVKGEIV